MSKQAIARLRCRHCDQLVMASSKGALRGLMLDLHKRADGTHCPGGMSAGEPVPRSVEQLRRDLTRLEQKVAAASERRRDLPAGSSRSRVTSANAKWSTACEARDRVLRELELRS